MTPDSGWISSTKFGPPELAQRPSYKLNHSATEIKSIYVAFQVSAQFSVIHCLPTELAIPVDIIAFTVD